MAGAPSPNVLHPEDDAPPAFTALRRGKQGRGYNIYEMAWLLVFDEIEPAGRIRHARRREVVVNGCRAGSRLAEEALRAEIDPDEVSARSRRVELHRAPCRRFGCPPVAG